MNLKINRSIVIDNKIYEISLKIKLEDMIDFEELVMDELDNIKNKFPKLKLNIWHNGIDENYLNKFIKKYNYPDDEIFVNSIYKKNYDFFVIVNDEDNMEYPSNWKYKYVGDVMTGIFKFKELLDIYDKKGNIH